MLHRIGIAALSGALALGAAGCTGGGPTVSAQWKLTRPNGAGNQLVLDAPACVGGGGHRTLEGGYDQRVCDAGSLNVRCTRHNVSEGGINYTVLDASVSVTEAGDRYEAAVSSLYINRATGTYDALRSSNCGVKFVEQNVELICGVGNIECQCDADATTAPESCTIRAVNIDGDQVEVQLVCDTIFEKTEGPTGTYASDVVGTGPNNSATLLFSYCPLI